MIEKFEFIRPLEKIISDCMGLRTDFDYLYSQAHHLLTKYQSTIKEYNKHSSDPINIELAMQNITVIEKQCMDLNLTPYEKELLVRGDIDEINRLDASTKSSLKEKINQVIKTA